ncbi:hypothetical protein GGH94_000519 [Coemansia aciculifera]|uniref:Uncharacterized protein n=1 Tax=Coemansia aciculifera TaxID=417176 RepID=A0A9W8INI7_9FUNG|nr:hypothetical protein GGH94_000519 [Coemansia aciculifera]KAJ2876850.1 hypothetical protein GGH93_000443 [Coemansia aciculifera]
MNSYEACEDIAALSTVCGREGYQSQSSRYQNADDIVGKVSMVVVRSLGHSMTRRPPAKCKAAIRTLSCSVVFPQCPSDASATPMPHYSELLNRVGSACDVGIDELSDRLLATLSQQRSEEGASRHWRTSLARISDEWSWAQQKLAWPAQHGASIEAAGADSAAGDLAVCAAMCFVLWWFGVWLVRQWSRDMAGAFSQLRHQPPRPLGPSNKETDVAIEIGD